MKWSAQDVVNCEFDAKVVVENEEAEDEMWQNRLRLRFYQSASSHMCDAQSGEGIGGGLVYGGRDGVGQSDNGCGGQNC